MLVDEKIIGAIKNICDRMSERTASLFLGAGINYGLDCADGERFPIGKGLSNWICRDLLETPELDTNLDEAAGMAIHKFGREAFNSYIYKMFSRYKPGTTHLSLAELPWDTIFTTNYDLLVEQAFDCKTITPSGEIQPIYSLETDLTRCSEDTIIYYKLHGSIDVANTETGRLIITKEDYRYYTLHRKPLFKRLKNDLQRKTIVFIGYSFADSNFQEILDQCLYELETSFLPSSYAVRVGFTPVEETYWKEKYNIQLLNIDGAAFLTYLRDSWVSDKYTVTPHELRMAKEWGFVDGTARFQKIGESFHKVSSAECTGFSRPDLFFRGAEPLWSDIKEKVPAARDIYWDIMESLFPELVDPKILNSCYLITGAAGTGKTTLLYSLGLDLADDFDIPVLLHIPGTPLDARVIGTITNEADPKRIVVFIRHASEYFYEIERFFEELRYLKLPVTIILEERKNQWKHINSSKKINPVEFEIGTLSEGEIGRILDGLEKHHLLGKLTGTSREYQLAHFSDLAAKELIIALRELTTEGKFDAIIKDEYENIPTDLAKKAYLYVSALSQIDLAIRYETVIRLLKVEAQELSSKIFTPTEGILISCEVSGNSRHNYGFRLRTRHPIIASIIFAEGATDDQAKFQILNDIITYLDPGFHEDKFLLNEIVRHRELVNTFASNENKRAIYVRLETVLPDNPYVMQHRSILERDLGDAERAVKYARRALENDPNNPTFKNTLGLALELSARNAREELQRMAFLAEASRLFDEGIKANPSDPYGYLGKYSIKRNEIEREVDPEKASLMEAELLSFLDTAYELTGESDVIATQLASQKLRLGEKPTAIEILKKAVKENPSNSRIRDLLIGMILDLDKNDALQIALEGVKLDPTSWRLYRHVARLMRMQKSESEAVIGNYEAAIRYNKSDIQLLVEFAAYLFMINKKSEAKEIFSQAKNLPVISYAKNRILEWWKDDNGKKILFAGKVSKILGAKAWVRAVPFGFEAFFWRNNPELFKLNEGDSLSFYVGFNAHGPTAKTNNFKHQ